jgi:glycosyltransferase involved in cell wall biosynthesis
LVEPTIVVFVAHSPERWMLTVRSALTKTSFPIVIGVLYPVHGATFDSLVEMSDGRLAWGTVGSISELINTTYQSTVGPVIVIDDAISLPDDPFGPALALLKNDLRVASVSFWCNAASWLSFPTRNAPQTRPLDGHDETSITRTLRTLQPRQEPAPVPHAAGPVMVLSGVALRAVGRLEAPASARLDVAIADFSARAAQRGFVNVVDASTFITRSADTAIEPIDDDLRADDLGWLLHRYRHLIGIVPEHRNDGESAFANQHQLARVKSEGLRLLIDGSCFGPHETGTQVACVQTIRSLANHSGVRSVCVTIPGPIPSYAYDVLTLPSVEARTTSNPGAFGIVDVAFRPYQPVEGYDPAPWRDVSMRYVVSMLDVIAYTNGAYFPDGGAWQRYRTSIDATLDVADVVTVISADVRSQMHLHAIAVDDERITVVPLGTEHLGHNSIARYPEELAARGFSARRFALTLGVNYHHKNRDLAIAAHRHLRQRGHDIDLVLAGPAVPFGTSRLAESAERFADPTSESWLHVLPEVHEHERNWLLSHASLAWYPTSAEGFGLPPFEAAAFGVPTVSVGFGPLRELLSGTSEQYPLLARSWSAEDLADVGEALLNDPSAATAHCEAIAASGRQYSWEAHADRLVLSFRRALASPRRRRR